MFAKHMFFVIAICSVVCSADAQVSKCALRDCFRIILAEEKVKNVLQHNRHKDVLYLADCNIPNHIYVNGWDTLSIDTMIVSIESTALLFVEDRSTWFHPLDFSFDSDKIFIHLLISGWDQIPGLEYFEVQYTFRRDEEWRLIDSHYKPCAFRSGVFLYDD